MVSAFMSDFIFSFEPEPPILLRFPANPPDLWPLTFFPHASCRALSFLLSFLCPFCQSRDVSLRLLDKQKGPPLRQKEANPCLNSGPSFPLTGRLAVSPNSATCYLIHSRTRPVKKKNHFS